MSRCITLYLALTHDSQLNGACCCPDRLDCRWSYTYSSAKLPQLLRHHSRRPDSRPALGHAQTEPGAQYI